MVTKKIEDTAIPFEEGTLTGEKAQAFFWGEAMVRATLKHGDACRVLREQSLPQLGEGGMPLDALASLLDSRDQLQEPGELLLSAESTLVSGGSSPFYFLDLRHQGVAEDFCILDKIPTVQDSLVRSRLQKCVWHNIANEPATRSSTARTSFKHIAGLLGVSHSDILASNFIFARSRRFRASKTIWEQHLDCLPAHELMVEMVKPEVLWVTGSDPKALELSGPPVRVSWRALRSDPSARVARGKFEFCGRQLHVCITPDLASWDATSEEDQDALSWALEGRAV
jgi:hypothetical protein